MLPYLFTQRDVHSTTGKESLKPRLELGAQTHDALRPAVLLCGLLVRPPLGLRLTGNRAETENVEINPPDSVIDQNK